ncbi:hypothetical protein EDB92DRAFT_1944403 [Lactarius akahatsu]|uniref:Uncharacterized protein n=1 Tax=Lactarius akahatsu TaxID=416441 RepID=A0AAD4LJ08_9AGAM|nr:hypothetical protein EDB92DRAFT_1944403 [Lactarius akahatsu]
MPPHLLQNAPTVSLPSQNTLESKTVSLSPPTCLLSRLRPPFLASLPLFVPARSAAFATAEARLYSIKLRFPPRCNSRRTQSPTAKKKCQLVRRSAFYVVIDITASALLVSDSPPLAESSSIVKTPPRPNPSRDQRPQSQPRTRSLTPSLTCTSACSSSDNPTTPLTSGDEWPGLGSSSAKSPRSPARAEPPARGHQVDAHAARLGPRSYLIQRRGGTGRGRVVARTRTRPAFLARLRHAHSSCRTRLACTQARSPRQGQAVSPPTPSLARLRFYLGYVRARRTGSSDGHNAMPETRARRSSEPSTNSGDNGERADTCVRSESGHGEADAESCLRRNPIPLKFFLQ